MKLSLKLFLVLACIVLLSLSLAAQPGNFPTSLHATRNGKIFWYGAANGGFESFTNVPIDSLGCVECHGAHDADGNAYTGTYAPDCIDCHPSNSAFNPDSIQVSQCYTCHGRQSKEIALGYSDVHRDASTPFKCWNCHTTTDMHGDGTTYNSMLAAGALTADCEDCHVAGTPSLPDHSAWDPASHNGKIHCTSCHAQTVLSCYNCHFESMLQAHLKRAKQPITDFVILANREKDGKVYPMTFQTISYQGSAFAAFGPFTSHTITSQGRTCSDCHYNFGQQNQAIGEYNNTGQIHFATWNSSDSSLSWIHGVIPMPEDYQTKFKMDFITYNGDPHDPVGPSKNWSYIGKDTWDSHQMFFATPLTKVQMGKLGFDTTLVGIEPGPDGKLPQTFSLNQNYPNPFNPATTISFELPRTTTVTLRIFNILGAEVKTLFANKRMAPGVHEIKFSGEDLVSGIYLYQLTTPQFTAAKKMILIK